MKRETAKLSVRRETLKTLTADDLTAAAGGTSVFRISLSWADLFNKVGRFAANNIAKKASARPNQLSLPPDAGYGPGKI